MNSISAKEVIEIMISVHSYLNDKRKSKVDEFEESEKKDSCERKFSIEQSLNKTNGFMNDQCCVSVANFSTKVMLDVG